jgi:gas vesicle protein
MTDNDKLVKGLVVGFLAGGTIGAVLALLYAPKSGKELRADLRTKADDLMAEADTYVEAAKVRAGDIVTDARRRSESLISDTKAKATSLIEDADKILVDARQKAGVVVEEGTKVKNAVKAGVEAFKEERGRS